MCDLLFKKVKCKGYLQKKRTKYVYANMEHFKKGTPEEFFDKERHMILSEDIEQETIQIKEKQFKGVIVGIKDVSTSNFYEHPERFNGNWYTDFESIQVSKINYIKCYKVYYANNKSRLVPVEMAEEDEL